MPLNCDLKSEAWLEDLPRILRELGDLLEHENFRLENAKRLKRWAEAIIEDCMKGSIA